MTANEKKEAAHAAVSTALADLVRLAQESHADFCSDDVKPTEYSSVYPMEVAAEIEHAVRRLQLECREFSRLLEGAGR